MKALGITVGCSATSYCPDDPILNYQAAVFSVRARQIRDTSSVSGGVVAIGTVNNNISCTNGDFSCTPYYPNDVPSTDSNFPFIQKAREYAGIMINLPTCAASSFCPGVTISRGQLSFFITYGILGQPALPPQQSGQAGSPFNTLPPNTGMNCAGRSLLPVAKAAGGIRTRPTFR